jgi:hypothetical protein
MMTSPSSFFQNLGHRIVSQTFSWRQKRWLLVSFVFFLFVVRWFFLWWLVTAGPVADVMNQYLAHMNDLVSQVNKQLSWFSLTISDQWLNASSIIRIHKPSSMTWSLPALLFVLDTRSEPQPRAWLGDDGHQALFVVTQSLMLINTWFLDPGPTYVPQLRLQAFTTPVVVTQETIAPLIERIASRSGRGRQALMTSLQRVLTCVWGVISLMMWLLGGTILLGVLYAIVVCLRLLLRLMKIPYERYDVGTIVFLLFIPVSLVSRLVWLHWWHQAGIVMLGTIGLLWWHINHYRFDKNQTDETMMSPDS